MDRWSLACVQIHFIKVGVLASPGEIRNSSNNWFMLSRCHAETTNHFYNVQVTVAPKAMCLSTVYMHFVCRFYCDTHETLKTSDSSENNEFAKWSEMKHSTKVIDFFTDFHRSDRLKWWIPISIIFSDRNSVWSFSIVQINI